MKSGRDDWIRTSDPLNPIQVRYQTALRPDSGVTGEPASNDARASLRPCGCRRDRAGAATTFRGAAFAAATGAATCPLPCGRLRSASSDRSSSRTRMMRRRASAGSLRPGRPGSSSNGSSSLSAARSSSIFRRAPPASTRRRTPVLDAQHAIDVAAAGTSADRLAFS